MSSLRPRKARTVLAVLGRLGFVPVKGRGKGAHRVLWHPVSGRYTTVTYRGGSEEIPKGTVRRILRDIGMSWPDFERLL